ncbi:TPA: Rha family transcriptional regulator [Pseudomonas aeruginosa]
MSLITTTNAVTMSSREIAELTGKRHDNVIADIRKMLLELGYQIDADGRSPDFSGDVPDAYGRLQHCFNLPRREVEIQRLNEELRKERLLRRLNARENDYP